MARHTQGFQEALRAGVKIAFGTDAGRVRHGTNAGEFALMVGLGMDPMRAIQSATSVAAELLRMKDDTGSVKPGLQADLVAVRGNPLDDVKLLQDVRFVMKAGKVVKEPADRVSAANDAHRDAIPARSRSVAIRFAGVRAV